MVSLIGLGVIIRFTQYLLVPLSVMKMSSSNNVKWANVVRSTFTDKIVPVLGILASLVLIMFYDYRGLVFIKAKDGTETYNGLATAMLIIFFIIVPILAYMYYYKVGKKSTEKNNQK